MPPPTKRPRYSDEAMKNALQDVALGVPKATAAKKHGVNRVTLLNKVNGKHRAEQRMGPEATLTKEEENILVVWIQSMARVGYPVTRSDLLDSVRQLIKRLKRDNTFTHGRPGKKWYSSFIYRNPSVNERMAENLTMSRARVTKGSLVKWYEATHEYLDSHGFLSALNDPQRVFNCDESAFFLNPKGNRVLAIKGDRNIYQVVNSDEKECLTVLVTASASGVICPPLIVFRYKRIPQDIIYSVPADWGIGKSDSGWMTSAVFYEFLANIFHPWLLKNNIQLPVILFIDGHSSHVTLEASEFCDKNQIVLMALHPNATHLIQPLDVSLFKALKSVWKNKVHEWRMNHIDDPYLRKKDFAPLLKESLNGVTQSTIANGFRKSGLVPWNPLEGIKALEDLTPPVNRNKNNDASAQVPDARNKAADQEALKIIEATMNKSTLLTFKEQGDVFQGRLEDRSLFELWKSIKTKCTNEEENVEEHDDCSDGGIPVVHQEPSSDKGVAVEYILSTVGNTVPPEIPDQTRECEAASDNNNVGEDNVLNVDSRPTENANANDSNAGVLAAVPSPFKSVLLWTPVIQHAQNLKKVSTKGIGPGAVSSQEWRNAIIHKQQKKKEAEEAKKKRLEERTRKRIEKEEQQQKKKEEKLRKQQSKKAAKAKPSKPPPKKPANPTKATHKRTRMSESSAEDENEWQPSYSESDESEQHSDDSQLEAASVIDTRRRRPTEICLQYNLDSLANHPTNNVFELLNLGDKPEEDEREVPEDGNQQSLPEEINQLIEQNNSVQQEMLQSPAKGEMHEPLIESLPQDVITYQCPSPEQNDPAVVVVKHMKHPPMHILYDSPPEIDSSNEPSHVEQSEIMKPKTEETFFIGCRSTQRNKNMKTLFKIKELLPSDEAIVIPLNPCNRFRTVFVGNTHKIDIIDLSKIQVTYVPPPVVFGNKGDEKYQFPAPLQVDW